MDKDAESLLNPFGTWQWSIDIEEDVSNDGMIAILLGAVFVDTDQYDKDRRSRLG